MFWLAFDVLATMFLFVIALLIVVGVIAAVAGIFIGLDNFLSRIFSARASALAITPEGWLTRRKPGGSTMRRFDAHV